MKNPFDSQEGPDSYVNLQRRLFQRAQLEKINDQIIDVIKNAFKAENIVLSCPERKCLFSETIRLVLEDLTKKLDEDSISV